MRNWNFKGVLAGIVLASVVTNGDISVITYYGGAARLAVSFAPEPLKRPAHEFVLVESIGKRTLAYARDKKDRILCINEECGWPEEVR